MPYEKRHLTYQEQLELLAERGLVVADSEKAAWYLEVLGYYRLSGYFYPFREPSSPLVKDGRSQRQPRHSTFLPGTSFESVVALYRFDDQLSLLCMEAIKRIEVAIRSKIAYYICGEDRFGHLSEAFLDPNFLSVPTAAQGELPRESSYSVWKTQHNKLIARSKEEFVKHFREKYEPPLPLWVSIEVWDFGLLSHFYSGLSHRFKSRISDDYGIPRAVLLASWLRSISHVRNICAHHSRLWNRALTDNPKPPGRNELPELEHIAGPDAHRRVHIYGTLAIMQYLLRRAGYGTEWGDKLKRLVSEFPAKAPAATVETMGFPLEWEHMKLWA